MKSATDTLRMQRLLISLWTSESDRCDDLLNGWKSGLCDHSVCIKKADAGFQKPVISPMSLSWIKDIVFLFHRFLPSTGSGRSLPGILHASCYSSSMRSSLLMFMRPPVSPLSISSARAFLSSCILSIFSSMDPFAISLYTDTVFS